MGKSARAPAAAPATDTAPRARGGLLLTKPENTMRVVVALLALLAHAADAKWSFKDYFSGEWDMERHRDGARSP